MSVETASAEDLRRALDETAGTGRPVEFWWRDDDLQRPGPKLDPLLAFADSAGWTPALAVVPEGMDTDGLAARLEGSGAEILVHGFAHRNFAPPEQKKCEFPAVRPLEDMRREAAEGLRRLEAAFPDSCLPCFVPPWNRIAPALIPALPGCGFAALSTFGPRRGATAADGLDCVNTHIDVIGWHANRRFVGIGAVRNAIVRHLAACAAGTADPEEACGLLTHHLVMVDEDWREIGALASELAAHEAVRLLAPSDCFCS